MANDKVLSVLSPACKVRGIPRLDGFRRKPDPESMEYLIKKLSLDRNKVWYIGDRRLDIDFARNSGVHAVLLTENPDGFPDMDYSYFTVRSLYEVPKLLCDFGY